MERIEMRYVFEYDGVEDTGEISPHLLVVVEAHFPETRKTSVGQIGH